MSETNATNTNGSRRNKGAVRVVSFLDVILALFLMAFYFIGGLCLNTIIFQVFLKGPFSKIAIVIISLIMWTIVFGITYLQLSTSYRLFLVTFQDALGPETAAKISLSWLRISTIVFGFIVFKLIYCHVRFSSPIWYIWVISVIEILLRLLGVYYVREFRDDLKHHIRTTSSHAPVSVKYPNDLSVPSVVISNHIQDI